MQRDMLHWTIMNLCHSFQSLRRMIRFAVGYARFDIVVRLGKLPVLSVL